MATFVSARLLSGFLRNLAVQRIDVDALVGDLPIEWTEDVRRTELVDWDDVAEIGTRLERRLGGSEALEDLGAAIVASRPMPAIRRLAGWTASPNTLYRVGLRWLELHMPRDLTTGIERLDDGRLEIQIVMPDGTRSCRPFFHMLAGAARALPTLVDLGDSVVEGRVGTHSATFVVTTPGSGTLLGRMIRNARTLMGSSGAIGDLEEERHLLRRHVDQLEGALFESMARETSLRTLADASDELLMEVGDDGRILAASDSARHVTGYDPDQIVGSHLTLWFHRHDDERVRRLLGRALAGDEAVALHPIRARHEHGRWIDATLEVRRCSRRGDADRIVVSVRETSAGGAGEAEHERLAARLRSLERRHHDLREMQTKLLEAERVATTREIAALIDASVASSIRPLADGLGVAAHVPAEAHAELPLLADLAHRIDAGLGRTLATLRRAKQERSPQTVSALAASLRSALGERLEPFGVSVEVEVDDVPEDAWLNADPALLFAAFAHVAEHVAHDATTGGCVEAVLGAGPEEDRLRIAIRCTCCERSASSRPSLPVDLELARGLLRAEGGDVLRGDGGACGTGVELVLPLEPDCRPSSRAPR